MAHIQVPEGAPGILGPMAMSPESTQALRKLADVLLRGPNTLTPAEREMIATYCFYAERLLFLPTVARSCSGRTSGWKLRSD
jgi:hypothetical protein